MVLWVTLFIYNQLFTKIPKFSQSFQERTIIVTGANVGLGLEAAKHLVRLNANKAIPACRDVEKGEATKRAIEASTGSPPGALEVWHLDPASYASVKQFALRANTLSRLDVLLEKAELATGNFRWAESKESQIAINIISMFLLGLLLLSKTKTTLEEFEVIPYLTVVASGLHHAANFLERNSKNIFEEPSNKEKTVMTDRYATSKAIEILVVRQLATIINSTDFKNMVVINAVDPGLCNSELASELPFFVRLQKFLPAQSCEEGSKNYIVSASLGSESNGKYISYGHITKESYFVNSEGGAGTGEKVWTELSQILGRIQRDILQKLE